VQFGALEAHWADDVQVSPSILSPPDCAIAAVGATSDEMTGSTIIEAKPTLRIASRRDTPAKCVIGSLSIKPFFCNPSSAR
jgi:hypothetical protein